MLVSKELDCRQIYSYYDPVSLFKVTDSLFKKTGLRITLCVCIVLSLKQFKTKFVVFGEEEIKKKDWKC